MKRYFTFAYGAFCYVVFLAAFLYPVGFVGGFVVPRTVDNAVAGRSWRRLLSMCCCSVCLPCSTA